jgi:hypothetical protein
MFYRHVGPLSDLYLDLAAPFRGRFLLSANAGRSLHLGNCYRHAHHDCRRAHHAIFGLTKLAEPRA